MGPIRGVRILEIGDRGEVAGKLLADAGAEVLKVEPPSGGRSRRIGPFVADRPDVNGSLHFAYWNTNKRGVTLDVSTADGAALWRKLVAAADVVIDSTRPGWLDSLGGGYAAFSAHQGLVWCSITPFGREGPWRGFEVNDLVSIALAGPMMSSGYDDHDLPPIRPDGSHSLAMAGEYAAVGVLTALWQRRQTGLGQMIDVSIHESVSCTTEGAFANWEYNQRIVQRQTGRHSSPTATGPWQLQCADGRYVCLMGGGYPRDERVWASLMAWMGETGAADELEDKSYTGRGRTVENRQQVMELIHRFVQAQPAEAAYRGGQACRLPWGYVRRPEDNLDDPHWDDRGFFVEVEVPGHPTPVRFPGAPYRFASTPLEVRRRAPLLGEHNHEVYAGELGYTTQQILTLAQTGVI